MTFAEAIKSLTEHVPLSRAHARDAMRDIMHGKATPVQIAAYLMALRMKGETVDEIAGSAEAMREVALAVSTERPIVADTCGTGGDGKCTFNVSTAAAFVVAGAGFAVAKHGNRSVSSRCGSADLLETIGLPVESTPEIAKRSLDDVGLAFLFAPSFHPAMKNAMPVRKELGIRTIFNLLGPLTNPARPQVQLIGVYDAAWVEPVAKVLAELGAQQGLVVHGEGHDEFILTGPTEVAEIRGGQVRRARWTPEDFGLRTNPTLRIDGGNSQQNAEFLRAILSGVKGPYRDAVCMNAGALIRACERLRPGAKELSLIEGFRLACESIDSGRAQTKLDQLLKVSKAAA